MLERTHTWVAVSADRLRGSDPGLGRLQQAASGVIAMGTALGLEYLVAQASGRSSQDTLIAMLLGAVVAMMGAMGLGSGSTRDKLQTAAGFPVAMGLGLLAGVAVGPHTVAMLAVFVLVMFLAVYVRRFGLPFFFYGFMTWMGYFFAAFLHATLAMVPALVEAVVISTVWVALLSVTLLRTRPERTLRHVVAAFESRARAVTAACADLLAVRAGGPGHEPATLRRTARAARRLVARQAGLAEAAIIAETWSDHPDAAAAGWSGTALRRGLLDAQHLTDEIATATRVLAATAQQSDRREVLLARELLTRVAGRRDEAARSLSELARHREGDGAALLATRALARAVDDLLDLGPSGAVTPERGATPARSGHGEGTTDSFSPVTQLAMGNLPGSPAVAGAIAARGATWNPLARLDMTTRQAVQVAVAGALAIVLGRVLDPTRYYWAVIAAFVAFTGTATRGETVGKATSRVVGTLVGLVASIWLAELTAGSTPLVLVVILAAMFLGFYLIRLSYAYMIFFITIMVGQLYSVLNEFSDHLLVLRLEETALGAAVGIAVALVVAPLSTRDTVSAARDAVLTALTEVLDAAAVTLAGTDRPDLDRLTRALDDRLRQLRLVARPLLRPQAFGGAGRRAAHRIALYSALGAHVRALAVHLRDGATGSAVAVRALAEATGELAGSFPAAGRAGREGADRTRRSERRDRAALLIADAGRLLHHARALPDDDHRDATGALLHLHALLTELAAVGPARPGTTGQHAAGRHEAPRDEQLRPEPARSEAARPEAARPEGGSAVPVASAGTAG